MTKLAGPMDDKKRGNLILYLICIKSLSCITQLFKDIKLFYICLVNIILVLPMFNQGSLALVNNLHVKSPQNT